MGQTLTHGIYLPDEGERNCYSGLAANWGILDGAVGTIAEHTTALAGKAPAVHTHTKADITDFPVYGTTAGTICEGNDSRLSDARTPVAHTHTKSDVTDLLNSNFIPSANNSYDLGSASKQWQNTYSKGYYYNGVAWGLDKANTWSSINSFQREITIIGDRNAYIAPMWEGAGSGIAFLNLDASKSFVFGQRLIDTEHDNRSIVDITKGHIIIHAGEKNNETVVELEPRATNATLGTSTNKWKTLNGINPGALSLPKNAYDNINTSSWVLTGASFTYTPAIDGYLQININPNSNNIARVSIESTFFRMASESSIGNNAMVTIPVRAGISYGIRLIGDSIAQARITPAEGNV